MPTYEYRCPACGADFEKFQRMSDEPVAECPQCGAAAERRISGGAGLVFKGSGFYITDYRSDSYKQAAAGEKGSGSNGKSGGAEKSAGSEEGGGSEKSAAPSSTSSSSAAKE